MKRNLTQVGDFLLYLALLIVIVCVLCRPSDAATTETDLRVIQAMLETRTASQEAAQPLPAVEIPNIFEDVAEEEVPELDTDPHLAGIRYYLNNLLADYHLMYFTGPGCVHCLRFDEDPAGYGAMVKSHWFVDKKSVSKHAALANYLGVNAAPTFIAFYKGREVGRAVGRTQAINLVRLFDGARQSLADSEAKRAPLPAPKVHKFRDWTDCRQYLAGQWTWPGGTIGALRRHLLQPPHSFARSLVESMSPSTLVWAHDQWHNSHMGRGNGSEFASRMAPRRPSRRSSRGGSFCPGGNCPL